tara:strand:+ start:451 stop:1542 length:1092 start_codon:yes stop_codon:yes gene_type:complete
MRKKVSNRERINDICALNWSKTNRDFPKVVESPKNMPEGKGVEEFNAIRVTDANSMAPCDSVVSSVDFSQENVSLLLAAGLDRKLRIFDIDGKRNSLKSSTLFEDLPLHKAKFTSSGRVVLSGKANFVYVFDINKNTVINRIDVFGSEILINGFAESADTSEVRTTSIYGIGRTLSVISSQDYREIATLNVSEDILGASYSHSGRELFLAGCDGKICTWDLRKMRCMDKKSLVGSRKLTALNYSALDQLAVGDSDGVVNVFPRWKELFNDSSQKELVAGQKIMSLKSAVDGLTYNCSGSLLALSSSVCKDSLRMAKQPSCTVYSKWPTSKSPVNFVFCTTFSRESRYLAIGNARGRVLLYSLR